MRTKKGNTFLFIILCMSLFIPLRGTDTIDITADFTHCFSTPYMEILEDQGNTLSIRDIAGPGFTGNFQPIDGKHISFGYSRSAFWLRVKVSNTTQNPVRWYMSFFGDCDYIYLYYPDPDNPGQFKELITGNLPPAESRAVWTFSNSFPIASPPGIHTYYLKLKSNNAISLLPKAFSPTWMQKVERVFFAVAWFFLGIMLALVIYNIIIYKTVREKSYLYLVFLIISFTSVLSHETGLLKYYFNLRDPLFLTLTILFSLLSVAYLTRTFLDTRQHIPKLDKILRISSLFQFALLPLAFVLHEYYVSQLLSSVSIIILSLCLLAGILSSFKNVPSARFYLVSTTLFLVGLTLMFIDFFGFIPSQVPHQVFSFLGFIIMVFLFSLGITDKINKLRDERIKALEALQESEKALRSIFDNASEGIYQVNPQLGPINFNPALAKIFGFNSVEGFRKCGCFKEMLDPDTPLKINELMQKQGYVKDLESRAFGSDGRTIYVSISAHPVKDENGNIIHYEGFMTDITERKNSEKLLRLAKEDLERRVDERTAALKKSEERYRQLIETMNEGFAILDKENKVKYVNPKLAEMFGYHKDEQLVGRHVLDFLDEKNREIMKEQLDVRRTGKRDPYEIEWIRKDGSRFITIVSPHPLFDDNGDFAGSASVLTDITALKEVEEQLKNARDSAEQANRSKSEFLANMSHEIRTPLNAVLGFTDLLSGLVEEPKQRGYLDTIKSSGKNLLMLINDILDLSKIEAGRLELHYEAVNPHSVFNELKQIFSLRIEEKGLDFIIEVAPDIPDGLLLDEVRLRQILFNLVGNAVKFTHKGFIRLSVRQIYTHQDKSTLDLIIAVEDTGIGIPPHSRTRIFDAFRQQDGQSTKKYGGTGLGLAITKRLVEMLSGEISLKSEVGKGTTFEIVLHDVAVSATGAVERDVSDARYLFAVFAPAEILVVDDVEANRELVKEFLITKNFSIIEAGNGLEALQSAREHQPDAILMDIKMPIMNGREANRAIKQDETLKNIPVIALTASAMKGDRERMLSEGFDGFLHKPIKSVDLYRELARFIPHTRDETGVPTEISPLAPDVAADASKNTDTAVTASIDSETAARLPELLEKLENQYMLKWKSAKETGFFNEITDFGTSIRELGENYKVDMLTEFGQSLVEHAEGFDIENMNTRMDAYPRLIEKVKSLKVGDIK